MGKLILAAESVVIAAAASLSSADIINVPGDQPTIQAGIDAAVDGDEVVVAAGRYNELIDFDGKAITVRGADPGESQIVKATIIDGTDLKGNVITCNNNEGPDSILDGVTITGSTDGAGMRIDAGSPTVVNCWFSRNNGIGMINVKGSPLVTDCTFVENMGSVGGGMGNFLGGNPTATDCTFIGNSANTGGGIYSDSGSPMVFNCSFANNMALDGGGLYIVCCGAVISGCSFSENTAVGAGGGMECSGDAIITNCTFIRNSAGEKGGGLCVSDNNAPPVANCLFVENSAPFGGSLFASQILGVVNCTFGGNSTGLRASSGFWPLEITNCIFWNNGPDEIVSVGTPAVAVSFCDVQGGYDGIGNIDADPLFIDPDNDDYRLSLASPCIDAADNTAVPRDVTTDLDGNPRFVDDPNTKDTGNGDPPIVDMGAYEFQMRAKCLADLTGDGIIGPADLAVILGNWGPVPPNDPIADLNDDGVVGPADLAIVLGNWGPCP